jgi:FkbM family methyltransferase
MLNIYPRNASAIQIPVLGGVGYRNLNGFEPWMLPLIKLLLKKKSGAFIDVGVNLGQTLLKVIACEPNRTYYGFEPNALCYSYVSELNRVNGLKNVHLIPVGLYDKDCVAELFASDRCDSAATVIANFREKDTDPASSQFVPLFVGDEVISRLNLEEISIVKIDVEGAELEVLRGLEKSLAKYRPFVLCEVLPDYNRQTALGMRRRARTDQLLSILLQLDYRIARVKHEGGVEFLNTIETHGDLSKCDYLFLPIEHTDAIEVLATA